MLSRGHRREPARVDALLVTEPGGHLLEMWSMRGLAAADRRLWCTIDSADVRSLLKEENVVLAHGPTCRNLLNLARNLALAWRVVRATRPRVVLCTGSGIVVPFAWVGRLLGARVVYVECGGRVDGPSLSCRMVGFAAHSLYVQWPELARQVRRGRFHGHLPWNGMTAERPATGHGGTVITVGTSRKYPFDRLVRASESIGHAAPIIVQRGASTVSPEGAHVVDFMSFDELSKAMAGAGAVVTHAGIGSVLLALMHGHRPVVMPRRSTLGEGVDNHQVHFARRLERENLAVVVGGPSDVRAALETAQRCNRAQRIRGDAANALLDHLAEDVRRAVHA